MTYKFFPLLLAPVVFLASCNGPSLPSAPSSPSAVNSTSATSSSPRTPHDSGDQTRSAQEQSVFEQLNAARAQPRSCGGRWVPAAPAVTWNGYLASAARGHANDMADQGYFAHTSPSGGTMKQRAEQAGYGGWQELGENIAAGYTVKDVIQGWLDSPGHCETLMDPKLKEVGMSYVYKPGSKFGTYWVQDFGTR